MCALVTGVQACALPISVTTGRAIEVQDSEEVSTTLTMATQKHVAMRFNSAELLTDIDDFSRRKIKPAVSVLVSDVANAVMPGCPNKVADRKCVGSGTRLSVRVDLVCRHIIYN